MSTNASERADNESYKFGGTQPNDIFVKTGNIPQTTYNDNVALGNVVGASVRTVYGISVVGEGVNNEQVLGDGMTGRYPFPTSAAQMTIVSTSADDNIAGTGARVMLVRGNLSDNTEQFESVLLNGTTSVITTNSYFRINNIIIVSAGSDEKNQGIITLKNGTDILAQINIGNNLSRTAIYSTPKDTKVLLRNASLLTGKGGNGVAILHVFLSSLGNIDLSVADIKSYQNQIALSSGQSPFLVPEGSDTEVTGYSEEGTGNSELGVLLELLIVE